MPPRDASELIAAVNSLVPAAIVVLLDLFFLNKSNGTQAKKNRVLALAQGAAHRCRLGILDLGLHFLQTIDQGALATLDVESCGFAQLSSDHSEPAFLWLDHCVDHVHDV